MEYHECQTYKTVVTHLAHVTNEFLQTGIAFAPKDTSLPSIINQGGLLSYLRDLAKELNRPFISAYDTGHLYNGIPMIVIFLKVPKAERFNKLISGLLISARQVHTKNDYHGSHHNVTVHRSTSLTEFKFRGDNGTKVFLHWREQCRTDPTFRILLKHD